MRWAYVAASVRFAQPVLRRIALEIIGDTAYVVGLAGTIVEIDNL